MKEKYIRILSLCCLTLICLASNVYAQEKKGKAREYPPTKEREYSPEKERDYPQTGGFKGPSQTASPILVAKKGQIQAISAASVKKLADDTPVMLVGNIKQSIGQDLYTFKDSSGEITVRIKQGEWKGLSVEETDNIVIAGYVKSKDDGQIEVDVRMLSKTKM